MSLSGGKSPLAVIHLRPLPKRSGAFNSLQPALRDRMQSEGPKPVSLLSSVCAEFSVRSAVLLGQVGCFLEFPPAVLSTPSGRSVLVVCVDVQATCSAREVPESPPYEMHDHAKGTWGPPRQVMVSSKTLAAQRIFSEIPMGKS